MDSNTVLLVEDDKDLADLLTQGLEEEGYKVVHVVNGGAVLGAIRNYPVDVVILDILLPVMNGLEVCKSIRNEGFNDLPVLMLTALGSPENVVLGLDSGADDYLGKPFKLIELKARIRSLIRRRKDIAAHSNVRQSENNSYKYKFLEIDDFRKIAYCQGVELGLTSTEYRLLLLFIKTPKKVFLRSELLENVWGINFDIESNVVDVYVNYLRKKLEKVTTEKVIHTVVGMGYVLRIDD